ncbi:polynucleotide adenylyltransferase PcnB [Spirochaeta africana]|uniref:Poly(A) polymerase n=1 Tax=Spirochaeta africana (strain ATCC 700263 / DSM 8902 / Z-7692) TaxID=889378 RepID=H9UKM9_SPIAZ|nr:polynucleotide adenylyltransferase PcnB [Spirochaeta africana]AFG38072.1 poly(A) polymerase [Spirochaeta africana DSM 8902]
MLIRYTTGKNGKPVPLAKVYTAEEHGIDTSLIDYDAVRIARRLRRHGFQAYVVGGAVRDLLVGRVPKDFDMATDASPGQIRKLFRNSRTIGKRFRLVHIFFHDRKIIEVTTFRSLEDTGFNAVYGTIEEDAARRDFTLNSLYYDTEQNQVLDYTGGYEDIRARIVRPVIPLPRLFTEDPVRMIRAVKYQVRTGFRLTFRLRRRLQRSVGLLADTPPSRMSEEVFKIMMSGNSAGIVRSCYDFRMLQYMVPHLAAALRSDSDFATRFFRSLGTLDAHVLEHPADSRAVALAYFCAEFFYTRSEAGQQRRISTGDAYTELKQFLKPVTPPNREVEMAVQLLVRRRKAYHAAGEFSVPGNPELVEERKSRPRRRRRRSGRNQSSTAKKSE